LQKKIHVNSKANRSTLYRQQTSIPLDNPEYCQINLHNQENVKFYTDPLNLFKKYKENQKCYTTFCE